MYKRPYLSTSPPTLGSIRILNCCQLNSVKWYLIMVKVCTSLATSDHLLFIKTKILERLHFIPVPAWMHPCRSSHSPLHTLPHTLLPQTPGLFCTTPALPQGAPYFKPYPFLFNKLRSRLTFPTNPTLVNISELRLLH